MPKKNIIQVQLPMEQPDRCQDCPLLGLIPEGMRSNDFADRFKSLVCIGTMDAITKKSSEVRASEKDARHPHHRPCDRVWKAWSQLPGRKFGVGVEIYNTFRVPFDQTRQFVINFKTK